MTKVVLYVAMIVPGRLSPSALMLFVEAAIKDRVNYINLDNHSRPKNAQDKNRQDLLCKIKPDSIKASIYSMGMGGK